MGDKEPSMGGIVLTALMKRPRRTKPHKTNEHYKNGWSKWNRKENIMAFLYNMVFSFCVMTTSVNVLFLSEAPPADVCVKASGPRQQT